VLDHGHRRRWRRNTNYGRPDLLPGRRKVVIGGGLHDRSWAIFTASTALTSVRWAGGNIIGGIVVSLLATWTSCRATSFAEAADRIGRDLITAPPLLETGSPGLRRPARTFNEMQERVLRLVEDGTQMLAANSHDILTALIRLRLRTETIPDETQRQKAEDDLAQMQAMFEATLSFAKEEANEEACRNRRRRTKVRYRRF